MSLSLPLPAMSHSTQYFRNPAAAISYCSKGYIRTDWRSMAAEPGELRAIYEHVLRAMQRYHVTALLFVHGQPEEIPAATQRWLVAEWVPRAIREAGYERCALVETSHSSPGAPQAIGHQVAGSMEYAFFDETAAAVSWLLHAEATAD
ncbi:hypothetical protein [Hymenobacter arcticus]